MKPHPLPPDTGRVRETLELVRAYHRIADRDLRNELLDLIKRLGRPAKPPDPPRPARLPKSG